MPWYSKEQPTPFDAAEIPGLHFLHGDVLNRRYRQTWIADKKYPIISFPSGVKREIRPSGDQESATVHIFDHLGLKYRSRRDDAFVDALNQAAEQGYIVEAVGTDQLNVTNPYSTRRYELTFDEADGRLANVVLSPGYAMELLDGEGRALLPPLYHNEKYGMEAIAPLKFFTPDANWTWYPTEFDGDDLFFGLVSGFVVELGYFSLTELEEIHRGLQLPIERDLYFEPKSLKALKALHE